MCEYERPYWYIGIAKIPYSKKNLLMHHEVYCIPSTKPFHCICHVSFEFFIWLPSDSKKLVWGFFLNLKAWTQQPFSMAMISMWIDIVSRSVSMYLNLKKLHERQRETNKRKANHAFKFMWTSFDKSHG